MVCVLWTYMNTLIALVLQLLIAVQSPNVPDSLRNEAINLANTVLASQSVSTDSSVTPATQEQIAPVLYGSVDSQPVDSGTCAPVPVLNVTALSGNMSSFDLSYKTGCPIGPNTPIEYQVIVASTTVYDLKGTIAQPGDNGYEQAIEGNTFHWSPLRQSWSSFGLAQNMTLPTTYPVTFDISVGSSTQEVVAN